LQYDGVVKPSKSAGEDPQEELFRVELVDLVDERHSLVKLAREINWQHFDETFGVAYSDGVGPASYRHTVDGLASLPEVHLQSE
jgi:hypothetical protein